MLLAVSLVHQQALLIRELGAQLAHSRGGGSFRPVINFNSGFVKKPEIVFCVHCNKNVAHKPDMCYNNPKGNNYKGTRTAQVSRVCVSNEAELRGLHDQDTGVKSTGRSEDSEADKAPVCENGKSIRWLFNSVETGNTQNWDMPFVGRVEQDVHSITTLLLVSHASW